MSKFISIQDARPVACMPRDEAVVQYCLEHIEAAEPCSVIFLHGSGKDIVMEELLNRLSNLKFSLPINYCNCNTDEELTEFIQKVELQTPPALCILGISIKKDVSWVSQKLGLLRNKHKVGFNYVFFSNFKQIETAISNNDKAILRSVRFVSLVSFEDALAFMADLIRRFSFKPTTKQIKQIYELSGGHVGLIKSLYLFLQSYPSTANLNSENLIKDLSIIQRIQGILNDLPVSTVEKLFTDRDCQNDTVLKHANLLDNGKLKIPLLDAYITATHAQESSKTNSHDKLETLLTSEETRVYTLLNENIGKICTRNQIAEQIWGSDFEEKYSDWAIDQILFRIRSKINTISLPYKIVTKKGLGFFMSQK